MRHLSTGVSAIALSAALLLLIQCGGGSSEPKDAASAQDQVGGQDQVGSPDLNSGKDTTSGVDGSVCTSGATRCADNNQLETCNSTGSGWSKSTCPHGCFVGSSPAICYPVCRANDKLCDGDTLKTCTYEGDGYNELTCDNGCNSGVSPVECYQTCRPGSTRCQNGSLETCNPGGGDYATTACGANGCSDLVTPAVCSTTCKPMANRCKDAQTQETCSADGSGWQAFSCPNGCANDVCNPMTMSQTGWTTIQYNQYEPNVFFEAKYTAAGTFVKQTESGADPSIFLYDTPLSNVRIRGTIRVETVSSATGSIGLVFGYQDEGNFYLLEWKTTSDYYCGTNATSGIQLRRIETTPGGSKPQACGIFWGSESKEFPDPVNANIKTVVTHLGGLGSASFRWAVNQTYELILDYSPGKIRAIVRQGEQTLAVITSSDTTWASGKFGFYDDGVINVIWDKYTIVPLP